MRFVDEKPEEPSFWDDTTFEVEGFLHKPRFILPPAPPEDLERTDSGLYVPKYASFYLPVETFIDPRTKELTCRVESYEDYVQRMADELAAQMRGAPLDAWTDQLLKGLGVPREYLGVDYAAADADRTVAAVREFSVGTTRNPCAEIALGPTTFGRMSSSQPNVQQISKDAVGDLFKAFDNPRPFKVPPVYASQDIIDWMKTFPFYEGEPKLVSRKK